MNNGVTVVLGSYNGQAYIEEQLATIVAQTTPPVEIVVADDASSDGTLGVVERFAAGSAVPVRVLRRASNVGFAENFLAAVEEVRTRYVAFSDQDDVWSPRKLETQLSALEEHGAVLCVHRVRRVDETGSPLMELGAAERRGQREIVEPLTADPWGNWYGFTVLVERSLLDRLPAAHRGQDVHSPGKELSHDRWVHFLATTFGRTVVLPEELADYRQHGAQLYGNSESATVLQRLRRKLLTGGAQAAYLAGLAERRGDLLEAECGRPDHPAVLRWRGFERHLRARARIHAGATTVVRVRSLVSAVRSGAYAGPASGGLGLERLAEDFLAAAVRPAGRQTEV